MFEDIRVEDEDLEEIKDKVGESLFKANITQEIEDINRRS